MKEIKDRLKEFHPVPGFVCPAEFWPALGYDGTARYVAIWWEQCGDEASWDDGRQSFVGADWESYLALIRHNFPPGHPARLLLGGSDVAASFRLVVDRWTEWAWLAPVDEANGVLRSQWPEEAIDSMLPPGEVGRWLDEWFGMLSNTSAEVRPQVAEREPMDVLDYANGLLPALVDELERRGAIVSVAGTREE